MRRTPELLILIAFFLLALLGVWHHEPWRDELQAWMLAADSPSWPAMLANMRYEGHPAAWHTLLWGLSRVFDDPFAMQVLHAGLATCAIGLIVFASPFGRAAMLGLAGSYYFLYEYGLVSRNYALGVVAVLAFCALYGTRRRSWWPLALVLALLTQTNLFGLWLAVCLAGALTIETLLDRDMRASRAARWKETTLATLMFAAAVGAAAWQILPPADFGGGQRMALWTPLGVSRGLAALQSVGWTFFPLPNFFSAHAWNTNLMQTPLLGRKGWLLAAGLLAAALLTLRRRPMSLGLFLVGSAGIVLVCSLPIYAEKMRYAGHIFVLWVATWWLAHRPDGLGPERATAGWMARGQRWEAPALATLLALQAAGGLAAYTIDWQRPFSRLRDAAAELAHHDRATRIIVAKDYVGAGVSAYLHRPVYLLESRRWGSFIVWNQARLTPTSDAASEIATLVADGRPALLLLNEGLNPFWGQVEARQGVFPGFRLSLLKRLAGAIVFDESFRLYAVYPDLDPHGPSATERQ